MHKANWFKKAPILWITCIVLLGVVIAQFVVMQNLMEDNKPPQGWIVFRRPKFRDGNKHFEYILMDGDGYKIQWIGEFRGMPAWSPDGKFLAVSCESNVSKICILKIPDIPDWRKWPLKQTTDIYKKIDLPKECDGIVSPEYGLESISWSHDGKNLAVVCGDMDFDNYSGTPRRVCILPFEEGEPYCWEESEDAVIRAEWSPVEDLLVISTEGKNIYLMGSDGKDPVFVTEGTAATWTPDGKRISFFLYQYIDRWENRTPYWNETIHPGFGIAWVEKDGTGFKWLYKNPDGSYESGKPISFVCGFRGCRMSWSPNGRYFVFQAEFGGLGGLFKVLQYDTITGEMICLSCFDLQAQYNFDPDWRP